jgi:hypothetical protein
MAFASSFVFFVPSHASVVALNLFLLSFDHLCQPVTDWGIFDEVVQLFEALLTSIAFDFG